MAIEEYDPSTALTIVRPLATPDDMLEAMRLYEDLKARIIQQRDKTVINRGKRNETVHINKSGWLRIAMAFRLTVEPVSEKFVRDGDDWGYEWIVRATAPNGASMTGDGACWASEKVVRPWIDQGAREPTPAAIARAEAATRENQTRHNVRGHAYTRASNRAISNLVGGGEVSAEEVVRSIMPDEPPEYRTEARTEASRTATEDDLSIGEFVREAAKLGMTSVQLAEKIGIPQARFSQMMNRRAVIESLRAEQHTVESTVVEEPATTTAASDWNYLEDLSFRKRAEKLGYKTDAQIRKLVMRIDSPTPRRSVILNAILAQENTPDLATAPSGSDA